MLGSGFVALALLTNVALAGTYVWPNTILDEQDVNRWNQDGHNQAGIVQFGVNGCDDFLIGDNTGRSNVADWIRNAYHDMATHNKTSGTGGLDASIRFAEEQARPENGGDHFALSTRFLNLFATQHVSVADAFAVSVVVGVEHCGGPFIPFRAGRVDAQKPDVPGVPEPQDPLDSHIATFKRQGFNKEEMIGLVACGHTFGGVQNKLFPQIVPPLNDPTNTESTAGFDSSIFKFDNKVATEYIAGTTKNPLVNGANVTMRSDERIFSSDGKKTLKAMAKDPQYFAKTCASLFARMLDTVPRGVKLTEPWDPLPVKPEFVDLIYRNDGKLALSGQVRLWNQPADSKRDVRLSWTNRSGKSSGKSLKLAYTSNTVGSAFGGRVQSAYYWYNNTQDLTAAVIDPKTGFGALSFTINGKKYDQGGRGFPVQDALLWAESSCVLDATSSNTRWDVAVRRDAGLRAVWLDSWELDASGAPQHVRVDVTKKISSGPVYDVLRVEHPGAAATPTLWTLKGTDKNGKLVTSIGRRSVVAVPPITVGILPLCEGVAPSNARTRPTGRLALSTPEGRKALAAGV